MNAPKLTIRSDSPLWYQTQVWLDDYQVPGLTELDLHIRGDEVNTVTVRMRVGELDIDAKTMARLQAVVNAPGEVEREYIETEPGEFDDVTPYGGPTY